MPDPARASAQSKIPNLHFANRAIPPRLSSPPPRLRVSAPLRYPPLPLRSVSSVPSCKTTCLSARFGPFVLFVSFCKN